MTDRLSDADLDRLDALAEGATPGPWEDRTDDLTDVVMVVHDCEYVDIVAELGDKATDRVLANAELVAAVRNALPVLVAEVRAAREREAAIIGTGQIVTLAIEDGRRALTSWCDMEDCECPVHEEAAPPAGTYVTVRMDGDPAVEFGRVRITWEPVTEGGDDDQS